ncbi:MAG: amino acid carrier protein [Clostridiales bacterium]|nr:amino acid carrier protein [Clostridiales bacterium]
MSVIQALHRMVWGPWTLVLFLGTGIWFTVCSGGFQIRCWKCWLGATVGQFRNRKADEKMVSPVDAFRRKRYAEQTAGGRMTQIQSACTALAATVGTGNIVGVATALTVGGPGAVFWMWVSAAVGMMTAYAETCLGLKYRRQTKEGHWLCGPMLYMELGLRSRTLGVFYAGLAVLASMGMGAMVQANSICAALKDMAAVPAMAVALVLTALVAMILIGGTDRIARVTERLMPPAAGIYLTVSLLVILSCWSSVPCVLWDILSDAFAPESAGGGLVGFLMSRSIRYGLSRGVFSNEAGLGTLAILHGSAEETTPEQQGMWAMFEVFFDTIVLCTLTAFVILCVERQMGIPAGIDGAQLAAWCFAGRLGRPGEILVSAALIVFAFATIIAWYYTGWQAAWYVTQHLLISCQQLVWYYRLLYLGAVYFGCICRLDPVWLLADFCNGLMACPNLLALWLLSPKVDWVNDAARSTTKKSEIDGPARMQ